jgi:putative CRISPR-associated protein (TIGR02619 family)
MTVMISEKIDTLICTVGTSLLTNLSRGTQSPLKEFADKRDVNGTVNELVLKPDAHRCCAELNSIASIVKHRYLRVYERCVFLVSDSDEGRFIGAVLKDYIGYEKSPFHFQEVEFLVIKDLCDTDINRFRDRGLKNLVKLISKEVRCRGKNRILINATGGYKAQISFAGMIGQALGIAVAYMHERFSDIIILPPLPLNLDMDFYLQYAEEFFDLNQGTSIPEEHYLVCDSRFESLIESISNKGETYTTLSVSGQLFYEKFTEIFYGEKEKLLPPSCQSASEEKSRFFEDNNRGEHKGLVSYLDRICRESFVKSVTTVYYSRDVNEGNKFRLTAHCSAEQIEGTFSNAEGTTRFFITTTSQKELQRKACLNWLLLNLQKIFS